MRTAHLIATKHGGNIPIVMLLPVVVVVYRNLVIKEHYLMVVAWHLATSVFCEGKGGQCDVSVQGVRVVGA